MELAALLPGRFELELASPTLTGVFDGVCAVDGAAFRLQLFPDVGGKVLDVWVGPARVVAEMPGNRYVADAPLAAARPHLGLLLAAVFAELLAPAAAERVLGERSHDGAVQVQLRPSLGAGEVVATLGDDGGIVLLAVAIAGMRIELARDGTLRAGHLVTGVLRRAGGG
jgi:hypothetical protein